MIRAVIIPEPHISDKDKEIDDLYIEHRNNLETYDYILSAGDFFHHNMKDKRKIIKWVNRINQSKPRIVMAEGNHEITYQSTIETWDLVYDHKLARGEYELISVMDRLEIGCAVITFNHHGQDILPPVQGKKNILISHNPYSCQYMRDVFQNKYDVDPLTEYVNYIEIDEHTFKGYDYVYLGHMHMTVSVFTLTYDDGTWTVVRCLGSLGRTSKLQYKIDEVRYIPILHIDDDNLVETIKEVRLPKKEYKKTIDRSVKNKKKVQEVVRRKCIDPLNEILESSKENEIMYGMVTSALQGANDLTLDRLNTNKDRLINDIL